MRAAIRAFDYDASTLRDLDFTERCLSSLGKAETGRRAASWVRCDGQCPSVGRHDLLDDRQTEPGSIPCGVTCLERLGAVAGEARRDTRPVIANRHASAAEISHDTSGAVRMDQRVADQVGQGAPNRSFDAVHLDNTLRSLL